jgi:hypothetical protein
MLCPLVFKIIEFAIQKEIAAQFVARLPLSHICNCSIFINEKEEILWLR